MKKVYSKPEIMFEDFTLNENIAGDCNIIIDNQTRDNCAYISTGGIATFLDGISVCVFTKPDGDNEICYHVPLSTTDLFNS